MFQEKVFELFIQTYQDKYSKAKLSLKKDREELLAFYDSAHLLAEKAKSRSTTITKLIGLSTTTKNLAKF